MVFHWYWKSGLSQILWPWLLCEIHQHYCPAYWVWQILGLGLCLVEQWCWNSNLCYDLCNWSHAKLIKRKPSHWSHTSVMGLFWNEWIRDCSWSWTNLCVQVCKSLFFMDCEWCDSECGLWSLLFFFFPFFVILLCYLLEASFAFQPLVRIRFVAICWSLLCVW